MSDETNSQSESDANNKGGNVSDESSSGKPDPRTEQISNLNAALRDERATIKELKKSLEELKNSQLAEQGKYKDLYEAQKSEHESLKGQSEKYENYFTQSLEAAKKTLSKEVLDLLPSNLSTIDQLSWIQRASQTFKGKTRSDVNMRGIVNPTNDDVRTEITKEEFMSMTATERQKHLDEMVKARGFGGLS